MWRIHGKIARFNRRKKAKAVLRMLQRINYNENDPEENPKMSEINL